MIGERRRCLFNDRNGVFRHTNFDGALAVCMKQSHTLLRDDDDSDVPVVPFNLQ